MSGSSDLSPELRLSLDDGSFLSEDSGTSVGFSLRLNRSFSSWTLFNRSSSICTDSSDDLASLGGGETFASGDVDHRIGEGFIRRREYGVVKKDIGHIVDYFERYTRAAAKNESKEVLQFQKIQMQLKLITFIILLSILYYYYYYIIIYIYYIIINIIIT